MSKKRVLIVGGGAAGLELAVGLAKKSQLEVALLEKSRGHVWKPHLHEVASGALDPGKEIIDYATLALKHGFTFERGELLGVDRAAKKAKVGALIGEQGVRLAEPREIEYDAICLAVGSTSNDFGIPGAIGEAISLDDLDSAQIFHRKLLDCAERKKYAKEPGRALSVAIVGGGATGVELAAELAETSLQMARHGNQALREKPMRIVVINAAEQLLPGLSAKVSHAAASMLDQLGVRTINEASASKVTSEGVLAKIKGVESWIEADLTVWAAGVKAPAFLSQMGLSVSRMGQLQVDGHLRTEDPSVFAIGDCASADWKSKPDQKVPPRAQAAHQMAAYLSAHMEAMLSGKTPKEVFEYKDYGSLVSMGRDETVGTLMGALAKRSWFIEGKIAKMAYLSLYHGHQVAIRGLIAAIAGGLGRFMDRRFGPKIKLH